MAQKEGDKRRIFLFKNFGKYIKVKYNNKYTSYYDLNLGEEPPSGAGYSAFIEKYFKDEQGVLNFFEDIKTVYNSFTKSDDKKTVQSWVGKVDLTGADPKNLFVYYACDLEWSKNSGYCGNAQGNVNLDEYIGVYEQSTPKIEVVIKNNNGQLEATMFGYVILLTNTSGDEFKIEVDLSKYNRRLGVSEIGKITFTRDTSTDEVNGLDYSLVNVPELIKPYLKDMPTNAHLNKWSSQKNSSGGSGSGLDYRYFQGKTSDFYDFGGKKDKKSDYKKDIENRMVYLKDEPYSSKMPDNIHECDENADSWEIGCKNKKIAEVNKWVLGSEYNGVLTDDTVGALHDLGQLGKNDKVVTKKVYEKLKSLNLRESVIKNVVIKNLNELLKRNT